MRFRAPKNVKRSSASNLPRGAVPSSAGLLVIFDCDGVLVDSEPIAARLTAEAVSELGWAMDAEGAKAEFLGDTHANIVRRVEQQLGRSVPPDWAARSQARLFEALERELQPVRGVQSAIAALRAA